MRIRFCVLMASVLVSACGGSSGPSKTTPSAPIRQLSSGGDVSCAVTADSTAYCWGRGFGPAPVVWAAGIKFRWVSVALASGTGSYVCGVTGGKSVICQGSAVVDSSGSWSLGATPTVVANDTSVDTLSAGGSHFCGVNSSHAIWCWGQYGAGVRGDSIVPAARDSVEVPSKVAGGVSWAGVAAGTDHTCGLASNGSVYCWGLATQVGVGDTAQYAPFDTTCGSSAGGSSPCAYAPLPVTGVPSSIQLASNGTTTCALTSTHTLWCWGYVGPTSGNAGQIPVAMPLSTVATTVTVGSLGGYCIISPAGDVYCGTLGSAPALLQGGLKFNDVSAGSDHACGIGAGGLLFCWGQNTVGQLGVGDSTARSLPTQVVIPLSGS